MMLHYYVTTNVCQPRSYTKKAPAKLALSTLVSLFALMGVCQIWVVSYEAILMKWDAICPILGMDKFRVKRRIIDILRVNTSIMIPFVISIVRRILWNWCRFVTSVFPPPLCLEDSKNIVNSLAMLDWAVSKLAKRSNQIKPGFKFIQFAA